MARHPRETEDFDFPVIFEEAKNFETRIALSLKSIEELSAKSRRSIAESREAIARADRLLKRK